MSQVAARRTPHGAVSLDVHTGVSSGGRYLGPAVVIASSGATVRVTLAGGEVDAELALALPYAPSPGDVLLVIGEGGAHYVIGVLSGRGKTSLHVQGDLSVRAVGGALELAGDEGVRIAAPDVEVRAGTLRTAARAAVSVLETLHQRVSALLSVQAKQSHTVVEEASYTQARTASIQTEDAVTINGKEILLG